MDLGDLGCRAAGDLLRGRVFFSAREPSTRGTGGVRRFLMQLTKIAWFGQGGRGPLQHLAPSRGLRAIEAGSAHGARSPIPAVSAMIEPWAAASPKAWP